MATQETTNSINSYSLSTMASDRRSKAQRTSSTSKVSEDTAKCASCEKTFVSKEDKLMICERCEELYWIKCIKMKASVYEVLRTTESTHWFCDDCQVRAMTAVVTDRSIEETVKKYSATCTYRTLYKPDILTTQN